MGVANLIKLVQESNILEDFTLKNSKIVIDASSLYYFLYFHSTLDQSHGGDYSGFKDEVCQFFQALQDCNITPHVVLDGGSDRKKLKTLKFRLLDKLKKAKRIAERIPGRTLPAGNNILPPLVKDVFKQILTQKNIEFEQTFGEADLRTASLANELDCPVLSDDTDFYIYDLKKGVLPLCPKDFEWKEKKNGQINAKRYRRSVFCTHFNIDPALLPVFAVIAGNDFSKFDDQGMFEEYCLRESTEGPLMYDSESQGPRMNQETRINEHPSIKTQINRLRGILTFLRGLNLTHLQDSKQKQEKALTEIFMFIMNNGPFLESIRKYDIGPVAAETHGLNNGPFLESIRKYDIGPVAAETHGLPKWMVDKVQRGKLSSFVTDVRLHNRMMLTPLVEDFSQPSSYSAALRIRQFFYGLLEQETCTEFDRAEGKSLSAKNIRSVHPSVSQEKLQKLRLQHLNQAPEDLRLLVLLEALELNGLDLKDVPDQMKLPVCVTNFWWKYPREQNMAARNEQYLHALLLGFVYGEHLNPEGEFENQMNTLKDGGKMLRPDVAHAFCQWQCCFRQSLHLNQLLCFPLPEPDCSRLYCGPLLHQLTAGSEIQPETFKKLMNTKQRELFDILQKILEHESLWQLQRRKKNKKQNQKN